MASYAFGEPVTLTLTDASGATASLASFAEVVLTIVQPDGTPVVKRKSDSTLNANPYLFQPAQIGRHVYYYATTTPTGASDAQPFDVEASGAAPIVSLADVKARLPNTTAADDAELALVLDAASDTIEGYIGKVRQQTYTEWHAGGGPEIVLHRRPVIKITSVVEYAGTVNYPLTEQSPDSGNPLDAFGFFAFYDSGLIQRTAYGVPSWFASMPWWTTKTPAWFVATPNRVGSGTGRVKVVYTAGRSVVAGNIRSATIALVQFWWTEMKASGSVTFDQPRLTGFGVPNFVIDMLGEDARHDGFAS